METRLKTKPRALYANLPKNQPLIIVLLIETDAQASDQRHINTRRHNHPIAVLAKNHMTGVEYLPCNTGNYLSICLIHNIGLVIEPIAFHFQGNWLGIYVGERDSSLGADNYES